MAQNKNSKIETNMERKSFAKKIEEKLDEQKTTFGNENPKRIFYRRIQVWICMHMKKNILVNMT